MTSSAEVYLYVDRDYTRTLDSVTNTLKNHGHRVLVGRDFDELLLLLEISQPSVVFCAFASYQATKEQRFQTLVEQAIGQKIPIIVLGPHDPRDGFTLYRPEETDYEIHHLPFAACVETISGFAVTGQESIGEQSRSFSQKLDHSKSDTTPPHGKFQAERSRFAGGGTDEKTDLGAEIATDSRPAVLTEPSVPIPDRAENYRGEISGPITLPKDEYQKNRKSRDRRLSSAAVQVALAVLAILSASLALVFAREPTMKLPTPIAPAVGAVGDDLSLNGGGREVDDPSPDGSDTEIVESLSDITE